MHEPLCTYPTCREIGGHGPFGNLCQRHWAALSEQDKGRLRFLRNEILERRKPKEKRSK